jgi:hypothetical protein
MTAFPEMIRNVAVVGHLHHGKTALLDMLVFETHKLIWDADAPVSLSTDTSYALPEVFCCRHATLTLTSYLGNVLYPLNPLLCPLSFPLPLENHIWCTLSTHLGMSILLMKLPAPSVWQMVFCWLLTLWRG